MVNKNTVNRINRFSKAPPGYSLTNSRGQWPWDKPPELNTPAEAVDYHIENLEKPDIQEYTVQILAAGISIEEIVNTTVKLGFMEGKYSVDVAEIIKAPLAFYLMGLAAEAGVPAKVFTTPDGMPRTNYGMKDHQILNIMRDRNPEFANYITRVHPEVEREEENRMQQMQAQSFLAVEPQENEVPELEEPEEMPEEE